MDNKYYDGTKLLSLKDINGETPEIFICTSNRSAGKTTYFSRLCVKRFKENKGKFCLVYRFKYEMSDCADKFFKDIGSLFFPEDEMTEKIVGGGIFRELFLNKESCGYAVSLNCSDQLKKYSHFFSDVNRIMFDEFQSETNHYCQEELRKFISLHTSIARGHGEMARYVPVYMVSNPVSIINPYYTELGISSRLQENTHFLKGDGFVLEQGFNEAASKAQKESPFNRAFAKHEYMAYSTEAIYLNDNLAFIERPEGNCRYIVTMKCDGKNYSIKEYRDLGIVYCDDKYDETNPNKFSITTDDHNINYVMLQKHGEFIMQLRFLFEHGAFRFKNLKCKEALLKAISY